jgi:hypothetical protein
MGLGRDPYNDPATVQALTGPAEYLKAWDVYTGTETGQNLGDVGFDYNSFQIVNDSGYQIFVTSDPVSNPVTQPKHVIPPYSVYGQQMSARAFFWKLNLPAGQATPPVGEHIGFTLYKNAQNPTFYKLPDSLGLQTTNVSGGVTITAGTVNIGTMPGVTISSGTVNIGTMPGVTISGGTVNVGTIAAGITIAAGQSVNIGTMPGVTIAGGTVNIGTFANAIAISGNVNIGTMPGISISGGTVTVGSITNTVNIQGVNGGINVGGAHPPTNLLTQALPSGAFSGGVYNILGISHEILTASVNFTSPGLISTISITGTQTGFVYYNMLPAAGFPRTLSFLFLAGDTGLTISGTTTGVGCTLIVDGRREALTSATTSLGQVPLQTKIFATDTQQYNSFSPVPVGEARQTSQVYTAATAQTVVGRGASASTDGYNGAIMFEVNNPGTASLTWDVMGSYDTANWYVVGMQRVDAQEALTRVASAQTLANGARQVWQVLDIYPNMTSNLATVVAGGSLTAKLYLVAV